MKSEPIGAVMKEIAIETPAKINLSIDVTGKLPNGYHSVEMIMQSISLSDTVIVEKRSSGLSISCGYPYVPNDARNIAWKAAEAFFAVCPEKGGAHITIKKNIPVSAGLAGGSTNAAGVLKALNRLYGGHLSDVKIIETARKLGADVPFCVEGGTALAHGIGDELIHLPAFTDVTVVLVKPPFPVSTAWVYKNLDLNNLGERPNTSALLAAINDMDILTLARNMRNVLESVTLGAFRDVRSIIDAMLVQGALGSRMSGSGPAVLGIFDDDKTAENACEYFRKQYDHVFLTKTIGRGEMAYG